MRLKLKIYDISNQYKSINQSIKSALGFSIKGTYKCHVNSLYQFVMSIQRSLTRATQLKSPWNSSSNLPFFVCMAKEI